MRRLLVTGASGYLGAYLIGAAQSAAEGWEVSGTYFSQAPHEAAPPLRRVDLRDREAVGQLLAAVEPEAVIHAACSNRDEGNIEAVVPAAENLAAACSATGARLVHVSTDMVFDGEHAPYSDDSPTRPIMPYGRAKAQAEAVITQVYPAAAIGRPSLIWALDPLDRQTRWLVNLLSRGQAITLFTDEVRCPVYLPDLAAALLELAARPEVSGPLNLCGRQPLSRWEFGMRLLSALRLTPGPNVVPGTVAESGLARARNLTLECRRAEQLLQARLRGVDDVLTDGPSLSILAQQDAS